jgi:inosine-uridine nucleoside N-ribohydrolase
MAQRVVIIADPGIDTAFAVALAVTDPSLEVLGLLATPGNVPAEQATQNVHTLIELLDPPRWPRLGAAPPVNYGMDALEFHGPGGLGGVSFPGVKKHTAVASDKQLVELLREFPRSVTVLNLGPMTVLGQALDRDPELAGLVERIVAVGGAWHEPGNASAVAEYHLACDPVAARRVLRCGAPLTLIPLDVTRKVVFSPSDLLELPNAESRTCRFLRQIVPYGIRATANRYGIEGFHLKDVLGVFALTRPSSLTTRQMVVDVETRGEITRGMMVVDARPNASEKPNVHLGVGVDASAVRTYIDDTLGRAL